jgi:carboxylesterase type B
MKTEKLNRRNFLKSSVVAASILTFSNSIFAQNESPIATTKYGKVRGNIDNNVNCFKGIRYGSDTSVVRYVQEIRTMPFQKIVEVLNTKDPVLPFGGVNFAPALDEKNLLRHPFYPNAPNQSNNIPMIIGNTHDETRAFLGGDESNFKITWEELPEKLIPNMRVDIKPEEVIENYRKLYPNLTASDLLFKITTASRSWRGAIIEAEERAKSGFPAFAYQLDWKSTREDGKFGAPHGADIQLVFDNIAKQAKVIQTTS